MNLGRDLSIPHLLFVDDILLFRFGSLIQIQLVKETMDLFITTTYVMVSLEKSAIYFSHIEAGLVEKIKRMYNLHQSDFDSKMKYLKYQIKPNNYKKYDWKWLLSRVEKIINLWCNKWISH